MGVLDLFFSRRAYNRHVATMAFQKQQARDEALRPALLHALREKREALTARLHKLDCLEEAVYRFYHQAFKVYAGRIDTERTVALLQRLLPDRPLDAWFTQIIREDTGHTFEPAHNETWLPHTRPIPEVLFHARYFLHMASRYAEEFGTTPQLLPSGVAARLYLFDVD